jgi:nucleotide-binding universal stress UspA family protein
LSECHICAASDKIYLLVEKIDLKTLGVAVGCDTPFRLIVVGVDGSDGSRRALEWVARAAPASGGRVLAVHVLTFNHELLRDLTLDTMRTWRRDLEMDLRTRWVMPLIERGVDHRGLLVEADSRADGLLQTAYREGGDLLVVGAKGHGGLADRVLGGVSYRVTQHARLPVVVVPPEWSPGPSTGEASTPQSDAVVS